MDETIKKSLQKTACQVRMGVLTGTFHAKSGHPGGSLSIADLLTYLYCAKMHVVPTFLSHFSVMSFCIAPLWLLLLSVLSSIYMAKPKPYRLGLRVAFSVVAAGEDHRTYHRENA